MERQISGSELTVYSNNYAEKAWHLVSVLLSIGRPASIGELAGKCSLFSASPELVEFLCLIPNSPIFLTANDFVLLSAVAFNAFGEFLASSMPRFQIGVPEVRMLCGNVVRTYFRKRKKFATDVMPMAKKRAVLSYINGNEQERPSFCSSKRIVSNFFEVADLQTAHIGRLSNVIQSGMSIKSALWEYFCNVIYVTPLTLNTNVGLLDYQPQNDEDQGNDVKQNISLASNKRKAVIMEEHPDKSYTYDGTNSGMPDLGRGNSTASLLEGLAEISAMLDESQFEKRNSIDRLNVGPLSTQPGQPDSIDASKDFRNNRVPEMRLQELAEQPFMDNSIQEKVENFSFVSFGRDLSPRNNLCEIEIRSSICGLPALKEPLDVKVGNESLVNVDPQSVNQKYAQFSETARTVPQGELTRKQQAASKLIQRSNIDNVSKKRKSQKDQNIIALKQKSKQIIASNALTEERRDVHKFSKDQLNSKSFPEFESYIVEEEEGSGGYGTVYRARRRSDGITFAIKCPHKNAHKHHVKNELKMLERFGGRNFVIKYEGSFNNGYSDCFVLEHVEHDRPEVLKREVNIFQLQWYGYCMFRALASLHKQGVFHRDIKPGNFLFSCKTSKGYLIDFNLAKDLHQKHESGEKPQTNCTTSIQHIMGLQSKSISPNKRRKILGGKSIDVNKASVPSGSNLESKAFKKKSVDKLKTYEGCDVRIICPPQDVAIQSSSPLAYPKALLQVLLRSLYQGPKIDVWSAGVTLLYLITGKLPFTGDPEQNMKDIVKIRGSEDLWEVAKLHNRESSFPVDLLDVRYLPSMKIKEWCSANTKRPDFLEVIPGSLFDLIEKCLTVNPRLRISADEALRHEFFTPCHEALQKQRSMRRGPILDSKTNTLPSVGESGSVKPVRAVTPVKKFKILV
ncbi:hypothetical protein Cgig2_019888 [Carnegiea gigantea]|uniref:non-specific serine/threonine protein kinase n=1 Tax=Carnegiea gigantea TaxID=171969 RepID=A0A9Q1QLE1_9CARY|nr:hypothetical protein Cgig2_019888 [Carnegiea gigantea]